MTRDPVAAGDDCDAPHEKVFTFDASPSLSDLTNAVIADSYLASIAGGKATWFLVVDRKKVAVLAQQWRKAAFRKGMEDAPAPTEAHFEYKAQENPIRAAKTIGAAAPSESSFWRRLFS